MRYFLFLTLFFSPFLGLSKARKDTILTGVYVKSIHDLQPIDFSYGIDFYLWLSSIKDTVSFEKVEIINSKQIEKFHSEHDTDNGFIISSQNCKGRIHHSWYLLNYPFDHQRLHIKVELSDDTSKAVLIQDKRGFIIDELLVIPGWRIVNHFAKDTIHTYSSDFGCHKMYKGKSSYSSIIYEIEIVRDSWGLFFKLFSGLYIAFLVSFISFFVKSVHIDPKIGLCIGALFAAVANNYIVNSNIPASSDFSLVDKLHILTFFYIFIALVISVRSDYHIQNNNLIKSIRLNKYAKLVFVFSYIFLNVYFIYSAK